MRKNLTLLSVYELSNNASKCLKGKKITELNGEIGKSTNTVGGFNTTVFVID